MHKTITSEHDIVDCVNRFWDGEETTHDDHDTFCRLLGKGKNFVCTFDRSRMAPSRFVGYLGNTFVRHAKNKKKDGGVTDKAITVALGRNAAEDKASEVAYLRICRELGIKPSEKRRQYWVLGESREGNTDFASDMKEPTRIETRTTRIVRDTEMVRQLKRLHDHYCQLCGGRLEMPDGSGYSEGHHLKPLGGEHRGPDIAANVLVVCPNCHVCLDYCAIRVRLGNLRLHPQHEVGSTFVDYHNEMVSRTYPTATSQE